MYYPDFFKRTWHNCQLCIGGHSKPVIKRWVVVLVFALRAHNSEYFFLAACEMFKTRTTVKNSYHIENHESYLKPNTRLFLWAIIFQ